MAILDILWKLCVTFPQLYPKAHDKEEQYF